MGHARKRGTRNKPVGCGCVVVLAAAASTSFRLRQGLESWGIDVHMAKEPPGERWGGSGGGERDEIRHPHLSRSEAPHLNSPWNGASLTPPIACDTTLKKPPLTCLGIRKKKKDGCASPNHRQFRFFLWYFCLAFIQFPFLLRYL